MPIKSFSDARAVEKSNIRKILEFAVFVKYREDTDEEFTQVWTEAGGLMIPDGYESLGFITKEGETWERVLDMAEVESHGFAEPTRRDITKDQTGLKLTAQESKLKNIELYQGVDLSGVKTDKDGNFSWDKPSRPQPQDLRVLAVGKDGDGDQAVYCARWLPFAQVGERGSQTWSESEEVVYELSFNAYFDAAVGTAFREIWGGPGLDHEAMGLPTPAVA